MEIAGKYVYRFTGYNRNDTFARHLSGLGYLELEAPDPTTKVGIIKRNSAKQFVTNTPMFGRKTNKHKHGTWTLTGEYQVMLAGPPLVASATIVFTQTYGGGAKMTNTYILLQTGRDRLSLMSKQPSEDLDENGDPGVGNIEELSTGELIKVGDDW